MANRWNERDFEMRGDRSRRANGGQPYGAGRYDQERVAGYNPAGSAQNGGDYLGDYDQGDERRFVDDDRRRAYGHGERVRSGPYGDYDPTRYGDGDRWEGGRTTRSGWDRGDYGSHNEQRYGGAPYSGRERGRETELYGYGYGARDGDGRYRGRDGAYGYGRSDYDDAFPGDNPNVEAVTDGERQGEHHGRGPKGYRRSDERIREDVNDRLTYHHHLDASDIEVQVKDGDVTLSGTVDSRRAKRRAEDCVERVSGVGHVQNNLRVQDRQDETTSSGRGLGGIVRAPSTTN